MKRKYEWDTCKKVEELYDQKLANFSPSEQNLILAEELNISVSYARRLLWRLRDQRGFPKRTPLTTRVRELLPKYENSPKRHRARLIAKELNAKVETVHTILHRFKKSDGVENLSDAKAS